MSTSFILVSLISKLTLTSLYFWKDVSSIFEGRNYSIRCSAGKYFVFRFEYFLIWFNLPAVWPASCDVAFMAGRGLTVAFLASWLVTPWLPVTFILFTLLMTLDTYFADWLILQGNVMYNVDTSATCYNISSHHSFSSTNKDLTTCEAKYSRKIFLVNIKS